MVKNREMPPFTSWHNLSNAITQNSNNHCLLETLQKQTMHIIEAEPEWLTHRGWKVLHESMPAHPITLTCVLQDPFFRYSDKGGQANGIRTVISELSQKFDEIYKQYNGRTRRWIKKDIIAWFQKTEAQDSWTWAYEACLTDKLSSAVTDFLAIVNPDITIAVLFPTLKKITYYPTGEIRDKILCVDGTTGNWMMSPSGTYATKSEFSSLSFNLGWSWVAPASVSIPDTIGDLRKQIMEKGESATLPTLTKQELMGYIWRQKFTARTATKN